MSHLWKVLYNNNNNNNNNNSNNHNNNNNNDNKNDNNNKDLFASFIFKMALRAIEKKTIKTNKNVKIYHYINVNTQSMLTKIVKELKAGSNSKTKVKAR